ncbi:MAG: LysM peptidoglycan-binding domain-containing protein [Gammaproteobacteria bacterium]|nr:LysM peptidoglycan-binding domain-containing protein [Gammaproteobacteria bacterium]
MPYYKIHDRFHHHNGTGTTCSPISSAASGIVLKPVITFALLLSLLLSGCSLPTILSERDSGEILPGGHDLSRIDITILPDPKNAAITTSSAKRLATYYKHPTLTAEAIAARIAARSSEGAQSSPTDTGICIPPFDLWDRIRAGFAMKPVFNQPIADKIHFYSQRPDYVQRVVERATPYLFYIVEEAERRHLPLELALLPIVESAYQPMAISSSGAVGLWQFIPSTGLNFGLKQGYWYDGRRDIVASTTAALDFLESLYTRFDGDWELALAGYNAGGTRVEQAVKKNADAGLPTDYWSLDLPNETRNYIPKLLAISHIVANPPAHGLVLPTISDDAKLTRVEVRRQIDLDLAAKMAGISLNELLKLNPAFKRWSTDPEGPHYLLLPIDNADPFKERYAQQPPPAARHNKIYVVRKGDTLGTIAQRFNISVAALKSANELTGNSLKKGQEITIPAASTTVATKPSATTTTTTAKTATAPKPKQSSAATTTHTVRSGESLWSISRQYSVSVDDLKRWNSMKGTPAIKPGQQLRLNSTTLAATTTTVKVASTPADTPNTQTDAAVEVIHTIVSGDTLSGIARQYSVNINELMKWNQLKQNSPLYPGDRLSIYLKNAVNS